MFEMAEKDAEVNDLLDGSVSDTSVPPSLKLLGPEDLEVEEQPHQERAACVGAARGLQEEARRTNDALTEALQIADIKEWYVLELMGGAYENQDDQQVGAR